MFLNRRTLALWLGFFVLFSLKAEENAVPSGAVDFSVSAEAGTLLVQDDNSAVYWRSGFSIAFGPQFFLGFDYGRLSSDLPSVNTTLSALKEKVRFSSSRWGINLDTVFFSHNALNALIAEKPIDNEEGEGAFAALELPLRFGSFTFAPYFALGSASWGEGELYWFFGKPDIPFVRLYGLSSGFVHRAGSAFRFVHKLAFRRLAADIDITSNEKEPLFAAGLEAGLLTYRFSLERKRFHFTGTFGWLWGGLSLDGALTDSNQRYWLFPYRFYRVNVSFNVRAGFAALGFSHSPGIFRYKIDLGAFYVFSGKGGAAIHYKEKPRFGGGEGFENMPAALTGAGAAFLRLEAALPALPLGRKRGRLFLGLQKIFAVPWGPDVFSSSGESGGTSSGGHPKDRTTSLVKTALLSGLSFRASFVW